jgi:hypothetical protein
MRDLLNLYLYGLKPVTIMTTLISLDIGVSNILNEPITEETSTPSQMVYLTGYTLAGILTGITYPISLPILFTIFFRRFVNQIN